MRPAPIPDQVRRMTCGRCDGPQDRPGQRYCRECHNAYMRQWRAAGKDRWDWGKADATQRKVLRARRRLNMAVRRGQVSRESLCSRCRDTGPLEGHHWLGYDAPLDVVWLCRPCHRDAHDPETSRPAVTLPT